ncbi:hypothetical protein R2Q81_08610 [Microbacterium aquimaris]|uniref:hypothetical protein n=1 Tax=Microbacterium aquimaris TaxID=459816 RepID=UPI002AD3DCD8|nr:hypothetical protein [Microbacterium aquimaris]MDZ8276005.1 hypothetical protein [Microbacterium aquimaris]
MMNTDYAPIIRDALRPLRVAGPKARMAAVTQALVPAVVAHSGVCEETARRVVTYALEEAQLAGPFSTVTDYAQHVAEDLREVLGAGLVPA